MYTTKNIINTDIDLSEFFDKVSEYDVYKRYIGDFRIGYIYNSPFRKDTNPSFGIYRSNKNGKLLFKDYGTDYCGDCIKFVQIIENLKSYYDAYYFIVNNIKPSTIKTQYEYQKPIETNIGVVRQEFNDFDLSFWQSFGITVNTLNKFSVSSIKYYLCNGQVKGIYNPDNPMYAYKIFDKYKIYRPFADKFSKWRSNLSNYDIQGYEQLPDKGNLLIITKSLKDVMTLYELGYTAVAPPSESATIPDEVINELRNRFKRIVLFYDRDIAGMKYTRKVFHKLGLDYIFTPKKAKSKDISDYVKHVLTRDNNTIEVQNFLKQKLTK